MMKWEQTGTYIVIKENLVGILYTVHNLSSTSNNNTVVQQLHFCNLREYTAFALDFDLDFFLYIFGQHYIAIIILCYHLTRCYGQGYFAQSCKQVKRANKS